MPSAHRLGRIRSRSAGASSRREPQNSKVMNDMITNQTYPFGLDLVWVGRDQDNRPAAFITAGSGQVPKDMLNDNGEPLFDVEGAILDLPKASNVILHVEVPRPDDFIAMAERGFFVFDWRDIHRTTKEESGCYELVATPLQPITIASLAPSVGIPSVFLSDVDFSMSMKICLQNIGGFIAPTSI